MYCLDAFVINYESSRGMLLEGNTVGGKDNSSYKIQNKVFKAQITPTKSRTILGECPPLHDLNNRIHKEGMR